MGQWALPILPDPSDFPYFISDKRSSTSRRHLFASISMFVPIDGAAGAHAAQKAEQERRRKREEEEIMTGYRPDELAGDWQFKIVKGTFKTAQQIDRVVHEQGEFGWVLVEVFDQNRIRFKRPASEAEKD